jgi:hypothetical protein
MYELRGGLFLLLFGVAVTSHAALVPIEDWQFNDDSGTQFSGLVNDAGSASWGGNTANATADGDGNLQFTVGADAGDNIFRNATLTNPDQSSGVFELAFEYAGVTLAGGDATGANVGFGMRDSSTNSDLFLVRVQKQNGTLRLQTRISGTNTNLENFGVDTLTDPLAVRAVADLDTGLLDVYWTLGANPEQSSLGIAMAAGEFDLVRLIANTNSTDWGTADIVDVNYLTVSTIPEPSAAILLAGGSLLILGVTRRNN